MPFDEKEYQKKYRETHKGQIRGKQREWYLKNRKRILRERKEKAKKFKTKYGFSYYTYITRKHKKEIFGLLGNKCTMCGNTDQRILQIDHVHGGGTKERKKFHGDMGKYYRHILRKLQEGSKEYQLLCANCNLIKRVERREH